MGNPPPLLLRRAEDNDLIEVGNPLFSSELRRRDGNMEKSSDDREENMRSLKDIVVPVYDSGFGLVATIAPFPLSIDDELRNSLVVSTRVSFMDELRRRLSWSISVAAPEHREYVSRLMEGFIFACSFFCWMSKKFETKIV